MISLIWIFNLDPGLDLRADELDLDPAYTHTLYSCFGDQDLLKKDLNLDNRYTDRHVREG